MSFVEYNQLEDVYNRKYLEIEQIRREYPHIVQVFKNSRFAPEIMKGLSLALDDLEGRPLIVRSSSLLEDRMGAAFSGKYKSLFLPNVGTKGERLSALMDAIAEVYASLFGPDPIEYRAERNLLDLHEEMGIMIQEVVGQPRRPLLPARRTPASPSATTSSAGRRASSARTASCASCRASARAPWIASATTTRSSSRPASRGCASTSRPTRVVRYAPRKIDVINIETRRFETIDIADLFRDYGREYPALDLIASVYDRDGHPPAGRLRLGPGGEPPVRHLRRPDQQHAVHGADARACSSCCASASARRWTSSSPRTAATSTCCSAGRRASRATRSRRPSRATCPTNA